MGQDDEIDKELQFHIPERIGELVAAGVPRDEAERRARLELGGLAQTREATREHTMAPWMSAVISAWDDVRYSWRQLLTSPGFSAAQIATIAIGLGANAAIFTVVNSVLLKPLPVPDADRIVLTANHYPNVGDPGPSGFMNSSVPDYYDRLQTVTVYDEQAMFTDITRPFQIDGIPTQVPGAAVTPSFFRLLRVPPERGRVFDESEGDEANTARVILSHGLALDLFGNIDAAVGKVLQLTGPHTVVGVMPRGFDFGSAEARFWLPLVFTARQKTDAYRHSDSWRNIARLKQGATIEQAQAQINALNAGNMERLPQINKLLTGSGYHTKVERFQDVLVRGVGPMLRLLWGGALLVLLVSGVNVANLTLARASARATELTTRLALGAGRSRIVRLLVAEGLLVASVGGVLALAVGSIILRICSRIGLDRLPRASEIHMDARVVGLTLLIAVGIGVVMALVPLVRFCQARLRSLIDRESRGSTGKHAQVIRHTLVTAQVALTFVLLAGGGLLLRSFQNLLATDPGFVSEGVITGTVNIPRTRYNTDDDVRAFTNRLLEAVRLVPGVTSGGATTVIPLGGTSNNSAIFAEGYKPKDGESIVAPIRILITPGYFETMGTRLRQGRYFTHADVATALPAVIVDERLARRFWPDIDPIGKRMYFPRNLQDMLKTDEHTRWLTVVGVVRNVQTHDLAGLSNDLGAYYLPAAQTVPRTLVLAIRSKADSAATIRAVRTELSKLDPTLPLSDVQTMDERTMMSLLPRRSAMLVALGFAGVALFLSAVGIYGVLAYLVSQRTREFGIRMALGGTAARIFALVLREGAVLVAGGLTVGVLGALALRGVMRGQIYGVGTMDPLVISFVTSAMTIIALAACALPARRATRLDPVSVLGQQ